MQIGRSARFMMFRAIGWSLFGFQICAIVGHIVFPVPGRPKLMDSFADNPIGVDLYVLSYCIPIAFAWLFGVVGSMLGDHKSRRVANWSAIGFLFVAVLRFYS